MENWLQKSQISLLNRSTWIKKQKVILIIISTPTTLLLKIYIILLKCCYVLWRKKTFVCTYFIKFYSLNHICFWRLNLFKSLWSFKFNLILIFTEYAYTKVIAFNYGKGHLLENKKIVLFFPKSVMLRTLIGNKTTDPSRTCAITCICV